MASESQVLSPKTRENLQRNPESRQKDNKFKKLQPSEKKVYRFYPEKIEIVTAEFNGKKTKRYRYTVTDPEDRQQSRKISGSRKTNIRRH